MRIYRNITMLILTTMFFLLLAIVVVFNDISENSITGYETYTVNTKVELYPALFRNCTFELQPGWNMVSFYCFGMFVPRDTGLYSVADSYGSIFEYQANDLSDPWKSYNKSLPNWTIQQLNYMDRVSGYWMYIYDVPNTFTNVSLGPNNTVVIPSIMFSYSGVYSDSIIYLYDGWNFIGYPNTNPTNISTGLNISSYDIVKYYNTTQDVWLVYINGGTNNTLERFETYKGYWINVSGDQQWNVIR